MSRYFLDAIGPAILCIGVSIAAPPPGTDLDGPVHKWFHDQRSADGSSCCDLADGHVLDEEDWRMTGVSYEVRINGAWFPVPAKALRDPKGGPNPTGKPIAWYDANSYGVVIYCFAPGFEG